jgi:ferritin-like metal-binding protein YciE
MNEYKGSHALDAGRISAAQAVEHYEITRYGTLATWAEELGNKEGAKLLKITLNEEENTDEALSELAETCVNQEAQQAAE